MNFLRKIFGDRRKQVTWTQDDRRRKNVWRQWKDTSERLDNAVKVLDETVRMNTADFANLLQRSHDHELELVQNGASKAVDFASFAKICEYRYSPEGSLMTLCRNPEHEAANLSIAPCQRAVCPFYTERK